MGGASSVLELGRRLLQLAEQDLLDRPLEALATTLPETFMGESLVDLAAAGWADTLGDALRDDRLDRFVAESCTAREERALVQTLQALLGATVAAVGDDDPARLAQVPEPPSDPRALADWAAEHAVADAIPRLRDGGLGAPQATDARQGESRAPLSHLDDALTFRSTLWRLARQRRAADLRTQRWAEASPPAALNSLHQRLRDLALAPAREVADAEVRFVAARPVTVDPQTATATACLRLSSESFSQVQLFLSGHEQRGLSGTCQACGPGRCDHVRRLAGRLLDASLDPDDRLHRALADVGTTPSWRRLVAALTPTSSDAASGGALAGDASSDASARGELVFRLAARAGGAGYDVSALLRSPRRGGTLSSGRVLTLAKASRSRAVTDEDRMVLDALRLGSRPLSTTATPADTMVLRALSQHPRVRMQDRSTPFRVVETSVVVRFVEQGDGLLPEVSLRGVPGPVTLPPDTVGYLSRLDESADALFFAPLAAPVRRLLRALGHFRGVLPPESYDSLGPWLAQVRQVAKLEAPPALLGRAHPVSRRLLLRLSQGPRDALQATLSARPLPLGALWPPGHGPEVVHGFVDGHTSYTRRDLSWERTQAERLVGALGLDGQPRTDAFRYLVEGTDAILGLLRQAALHSEEVALEWSERLRRLTLSPPLQAASLSVRLFKRGHWLQLDGDVVSGETRIAVGRLLEAAQRGERFVPVDGDSYAEIEEALWDKLQAAQAFAIDPKDTTRLSAMVGPALLSRLGSDLRAGDDETAQFLTRVRGEAAAPPAAVMDDLRPYQRAGLRWLLQRASWATGACLADEMGLGKTIQAIALLRVRGASGPALVVAPTSVTDNWVSECQRFAPELTVHNHRGAARSNLRAQAQSLGPGDVLITSYDVLLRDADSLAQLTFATQVVDEAQWIKNSRTARARAVRQIDAGFRLALTGTPIENRLGDLYSLFALIAPGLFGSWARFRARFAVPIERYGREDRSDHLHGLVAPFMLRRRKSEVAAELPTRTEVIHRIELSAAERQLYQAATAEARDNLRRRKQEDEATAAHVLSDLTRLRQLACHPRLVLQRSDAQSSKLTTLLRLLDDLLPRGHRALIFSQFVQHLSLVREALDARGVPYQYLDGSTPAASRQERVKAFQAGTDPLFLISLKAGGAGINLTGADYVFHLDPWWNPAAEDQASDRAHRLGQTRPVTIVKLVTADSIEERVLELHQHKRALAESVLRGELRPGEVSLDQLESLLE